MSKKNRRLKILVIVECLLPPVIEAYGSKGIYQLQKRLAQEDVELHILTTTYPWMDQKWKEWVAKEATENLQFHVINTGTLGHVDLLAYLFSKPAMFFETCRLCRQEKFDIVHEYSSSPFLINLTALYRRWLGTRAFHTIYAYNERMSGQSWLALAAKSINNVIVTSRELQERFNVAERKVVYLPLGIDLTPFRRVWRNQEEFKARLGLRNERVVLFLGPLEARKGIRTFAEAARKVIEVSDNVVFVVATYDKAGTARRYSPQMSQLRKATSGREANFRILEGYHDVPLLMNAADIFVLPARKAHGTLAQPLTLLEAMASGKAIVASNIEGVRELILDGVNGLLFEKKDSEGLSRAVIALLDNEELRKRLGNRAREDASDFDVDNVARKLMAIYRGIDAP